MSMVIYLPSRLDAHAAFHFCREIGSINTCGDYVFDFGRMSHIRPFGMLLTVAALRAFKQRLAYCGSSVTFAAQNFRTHTYAGHMGFFQAFGLNFGNAPGAASGSANYIPLTEISTAELLSEARNAGQYVGQTIEYRAAQMASVLLQRPDNDLSRTITYSLREVMRNVVEHSGATSLMFAGQYWPQSGQVELAIADAGIGIRQGLSSSPYWKPSTDADALLLALQPGVSGKAGLAPPVYGGGSAWQNSGYGLFVTSKLCQKGGQFTICSGSSALNMQAGEVTFQDTSIGGTYLLLQLNLYQVENLQLSVNEIVAQGEQASAMRQSGDVLTPSKMTRLLAADAT